MNCCGCCCLLQPCDRLFAPLIASLICCCGISCEIDPRCWSWRDMSVLLHSLVFWNLLLFTAILRRLSRDEWTRNEMECMWGAGVLHFWRDSASQHVMSKVRTSNFWVAQSCCVTAKKSTKSTPDVRLEQNHNPYLEAFTWSVFPPVWLSEELRESNAANHCYNKVRSVHSTSSSTWNNSKQSEPLSLSCQRQAERYDDW